MRITLRAATILLVLTLLSSSLVPVNAAAAPKYRGINVYRGISAEEIALLSAWNVAVVRYQLSWHEHIDTATKAEYFALLEEALSYLDTLLPVFSAQGIKVILDMHTPPGGFASRVSPATFRVFSEQWAADALVEAWQLIAGRYAGQDVFLAYELLSEPAVGTSKLSKDWQDLAARLVATVLAADPDRKIVLSPDFAQQQKLLRFGKKMKTLLGAAIYKANIVHSVHLFVPYTYVKQGLDGISIGAKYPSKKLKKKLLIKSLSKARLAQRRLRQELWVGEFSVARWAPGADQYLRDVIGVFEKYKWNWLYHIFREASVWNIEHGSDPNVSEPVSEETDRAAVLKSYWARN